MKTRVKKWFDESVKVLTTRIESKKEKSEDLLAELEARKKSFEKIKEASSGPQITKESISGVYHILGKNSSEEFQGYIGDMSITYQENQIRATWLIEGKVTHYGYGFIHNNMLCLNFCYEAGNIDRYGVVMYEFFSEDCMGGVWTEEVNDSIGCEFGRRISTENTDPLDYFGLN